MQIVKSVAAKNVKLESNLLDKSKKLTKVRMCKREFGAELDTYTCGITINKSKAN